MVEAQLFKLRGYIYVSLMYSGCTKITEGRSRVLYLILMKDIGP